MKQPTISIAVSVLYFLNGTGKSSGFMLQHPSRGVTYPQLAKNPLSSPQPLTFALSQSSPSANTDGDESVLEGITSGLSDVCILALRVGTCSLMIHHGLDKIENVDGFSANVVAKFFGFLPGPASFWTLSAAATQVAGAGLLAVGVLARPVAISMMFTMLAAVTFHLLNTGLEGFPLAVVKQHSYNFELAAMYVGVLAYFGVSGAGVYSIDEKVLGGELKLYESLIQKVLGGETEE